MTKCCIQHWMLISRAIYIEIEDVNLDKDAQETAHTQSACLRASFGVHHAAILELFIASGELYIMNHEEIKELTDELAWNFRTSTGY